MNDKKNGVQVPPPKYSGTVYDTEMDGVQMDGSAQDLLNRIAVRGMNGWEYKGSIPVPALKQEPPPMPGEGPIMVWGLVFQRPKLLVTLG